MNEDLNLTFYVIDQFEPKLRNAIDPHIKKTKTISSFLDVSYHDIDLIEKIDPTHFDVILESYPKKDILQSKEIIKKKIPFAIYQFLHRFCLDSIIKHYSVMPYKFLADFPGQRLLKLNSFELHLLIGLLGMYDLKSFFKTSIDQKLHLAIEAQLSEAEKRFLSKIKHEKEKVVFKKMPLESWDRQKQSFDVLKYTRGLNRLSKAISHESPEIHQEIILRLPLKEKASFMTLSTQTDAQLIKTLYEEINEALDFFDQMRLK